MPEGAACPNRLQQEVEDLQNSRTNDGEQYSQLKDFQINQENISDAMKMTNLKASRFRRKNYTISTICATKYPTKRS